MYKFRMLFIALMVITFASICSVTWSQGVMYSNSELDEILAPVALYPDPLVAQMLPAATFPDQLIEADNHIRRNGGNRDIDRQDWDVSVKAIAYYPSILHGMANKPDWTIAVGQAYITEPTHVMWSIQRLRLKARRLGYLTTNKYQRVYQDGSYYRIVPVQTRYIYVPQYDPQVVYVQRRSSTTSNLISFGLGLLIGSWLNRDVDWHHDRVYYHGWNGSGWISNSRRYVSANNTYYVNNNYRNSAISVDRNVRTRDIGSYRTAIRQNAGTFRLPAYSQLRQTGSIRNNNIPAQRPNIRNMAPNAYKQNGGRVVTSQPNRTYMPSVKASPRSKQSNIRSNARPSQGVVRRNSVRSNQPSMGSNARPSQGSIRGNSNGRVKTPTFKPSQRSNQPSVRSKARTSSPSFKAAPKSKQQSVRSNAKPSQSVSKSRSSGKASAGSRSKSSGKDQGGRSKGNKSR